MYTPLEAAIAVSLYGYNVSPTTRAIKLHKHFDGLCADMETLVDILSTRLAFWATELAMPTAQVYVEHALEKYGEEARVRVAAELQARLGSSR